MLALFGAVLIYTPLAHPRTLLVDGVTGPSEARITRLLEEAAGKQSTFAVNEAALMEAVRAYPEVAGVRVDAHPPFRLEVRAIMRPPVARVEIAGRAFVIAGDGTILQRAVEADVPRLDVAASALTLREGRVVGSRAALGVLAAAPQPLLAVARAVRVNQAGVEIEMARGPRLIFGNAAQAADKWAAAAAIIADGSATGATYIDLRVPSRPAVGGLGGTKSASALAPPQLTATQTASPTGGASTTGATPAQPSTSASATPTQGTPAGASTSGTATGATGAQVPPASGSTGPGGAGQSPAGASAPAASAPATGASAPAGQGAANGGGGATIGATP